MSVLLRLKDLLCQLQNKECSILLAQQTTDIIDRLITELFTTLLQRHEKKAQVCICQRALQLLLDKLMVIHASGDLVMKAAQAIMFIRDQLPEYFNWDEQSFVTPAFRRQILKMGEATQTRDTLFHSVMALFIKRLKENTLTWRHRVFLQHMVKQHTSGDHNTIEWLLRFNLCDIQIVNCIITHWQQEIVLAEDQMSTIKSMIHRLNCAVFINHFSTTVTLHEKLSSWLCEEYALLQRSSVKPSLPAVAEDTVPQLTTPLSVAQFAAFTRLIIEAGILTCNNQKQLFALLTSNIRTAGTATISLQSFRNKYYVPEPSTLSSVKDLCIRMLNEARKLA